MPTDFFNIQFFAMNRLHTEDLLNVEHTDFNKIKSDYFSVVF